MVSEEIASLERSINEGVTNARRWLDERFECGTLVFHASLGNISAKIDDLDYLLKQSEEPECSHVERNIESWRQDVAALSARAVKYATDRSATGQKRFERAEHFYRDYWTKISEFQLTSGRYLIIGHATAIIATLTAITSSWDQDQLVVLLASAIQYFAMGLSVSLVSLYIAHMFNIRMQKEWRDLADMTTTDASTEPRIMKYAFIIAPSITFGLSVGWLLFGIASGAREIAKLKQGVADPLMFLPF